MILEALLQHKTLSTDPAGNPPAGYIYVYAKADGIYEKNNAGVVTKISNVAGVGSPAGNDKEIQYNNATAFAGATNVEIESGNLALVATSDPTAVVGKTLIYAKDIAGRVMPKFIEPSGVDNPFQSGLFFNNISLIQAAGGTTINVIGCTVTSVGTISHPTPTTTNVLTQSRRFVNKSATTVGSLASTRVSVLECWRGNVVNLGGFFVVDRFSLVTIQAGMRAFIGLSSTATTAPTNVDPTTTTTDAKIGLAINANTGNWKLIHNTAGTAPTVIDLGASFPVNITDLLEAIFYAPPNATFVGYRIRNLSNGSETFGSITTNLPLATAFLGRTMWATNNATAASVAWACARFGLETDF